MTGFAPVTSGDERASMRLRPPQAADIAVEHRLHESFALVCRRSGHGSLLDSELTHSLSIHTKAVITKKRGRDAAGLHHPLCRVGAGNDGILRARLWAGARDARAGRRLRRDGDWRDKARLLGRRVRQDAPW